jgi:hypothetical protein
MADGAINLEDIKGIFPCAEQALQAVHELSSAVISVLHIGPRCKANFLTREASGDLSLPSRREEDREVRVKQL